MVRAKMRLTRQGGLVLVFRFVIIFDFKATNYRFIKKHVLRIFQLLKGLLSLAGTVNNFPSAVTTISWPIFERNLYIVGLVDFAGFQVPTDGQLAQFRLF